MKARTAAKVARLKKVPNKGRYGMKTRYHSFQDTVDWEAPVGDSRSGRSLIIALAFLIPVGFILLGILANALGGD